MVLPFEHIEFTKTFGRKYNSSKNILTNKIENLFICQKLNTINQSRDRENLSGNRKIFFRLKIFYLWPTPRARLGLTGAEAVCGGLRVLGNIKVLILIKIQTQPAKYLYILVCWEI